MKKLKQHAKIFKDDTKKIAEAVKGKRISEGHRIDKEKTKRDKPLVSIDYMKQKGVVHREKVDGRIINEKGSMPTIVMHEGENNWVSPIVVPAKGADDYAIAAVGKEIDLSGLISMTIKSDQENSIKSLIQAVRRERPETIECMTPEESPVGESKSNGAVENAIRNVQGQVRTLKLMLEEILLQKQ